MQSKDEGNAGRRVSCVNWTLENAWRFIFSSQKIEFGSPCCGGGGGCGVMAPSSSLSSSAAVSVDEGEGGSSVFHTTHKNTLFISKKKGKKEHTNTHSSRPNSFKTPHTTRLDTLPKGGCVYDAILFFSHFKSNALVSFSSKKKRTLWH